VHSGYGFVSSDDGSTSTADTLFLSPNSFSSTLIVGTFFSNAIIVVNLKLNGGQSSRYCCVISATTMNLFDFHVTFSIGIKRSFHGFSTAVASFFYCPNRGDRRGSSSTGVGLK